jgi:hypothetical protein
MDNYGMVHRATLSGEDRHSTLISSVHKLATSNSWWRRWPSRIWELYLIPQQPKNVFFRPHWTQRCASTCLVFKLRGPDLEYVQVMNGFRLNSSMKPAACC